MKRALAHCPLAALGVVVAFTLGTLACAGETPSAETATTPTAPPSSTTAPTPSTASAPSAGASDAAPNAAASDAAPSDPSCGGADVDLLTVLANRRCRPDRDAPATPASAAKDLKVTLTPSTKQITPGGHVELDLEIVNTASTEIPLYFSGDLTLAPVVTDAKKKRVTPPSGTAPKASDPKCREVDCRRAASHIVLPPQGKAHARIGWDAVKATWPKTPPTECCIVHVFPVAAGPLPVGTYTVKVPLPYETPEGSPVDPELEVRVAK